MHMLSLANLTNALRLYFIGELTLEWTGTVKFNLDVVDAFGCCGEQQVLVFKLPWYWRLICWRFSIWILLGTFFLAQVAISECSFSLNYFCVILKTGEKHSCWCVSKFSKKTASLRTNFSHLFGREQPCKSRRNQDKGVWVDGVSRSPRGNVWSRTNFSLFQIFICKLA